MIVSLGLGGPKTRPKGVADGQQVNIPALLIFRPRWFHLKFFRVLDDFGYLEAGMDGAII